MLNDWDRKDNFLSIDKADLETKEGTEEKEAIGAKNNHPIMIREFTTALAPKGVELKPNFTKTGKVPSQLNRLQAALEFEKGSQFTKAFQASDLNKDILPDS
mmetsp:Transcript_24220/g.37315  ORF Transcript_24220/g.37315 Transcript_24220/m.37315 type:complete len:102 (+) Transcript_24220:3064-3369(+)